MDAVTELEKEGLSLDGVGFASGQRLKMWRIKLDPDGKDFLDHRIIFDLENSEFIIYGVWHRDDAYRTSMWNRVNDRR